jgi:Cys-rich repeat protein
MAQSNSNCFVSVLLACLTLSGALGCDDDDGPYYDGYYPGGIVGAWCQANADCGDARCCTTPACGHGMCTYACRSDLECPAGSLCEAGTCFLACSSDYDCLGGQHCAHAHTVCQY